MKFAPFLKKMGFILLKLWAVFFIWMSAMIVVSSSKYPIAKKSLGSDGFIGLLMNGFAVETIKERIFCVSRCDSSKFKERFRSVIHKLGVQCLKEIDMLGCYDADGNFDWIIGGIVGSENIAQINAAQQGSLRCQTSNLSKKLIVPNSFFQPAVAVKEVIDASVLSPNFSKVG